MAMNVAEQVAENQREQIVLLANEIKTHPAYLRFFTAYQKLQADQNARRLSAELQARQRSLRFTWSQESEEQFNQMLGEFNRIPSVVAFRQAERSLRALFCDINEVISRAAGVDFAANAKRSCCGG